MIAVRATGLGKTFKSSDTPAVTSVDLQIPTRRITGLVGPDGAGKTTLIRMMAGLLTPTQGELEVLGHAMPCNTSAFLQQIGYMPQKFGLYEDLSVDENLQLYARLQEIDDVASRITILLEFTTLLPFRDRRAGHLSGGMKQKLGLACALIKKPRLLLLDEPGVGVDPISRKELWAMVQALVDDDLAVLWGTSYLDEADRCDSVILMNEGRVLYDGRPDGLKARLKGRTYLLSGAMHDRREVLSSVLRHDNVLDAVLVGRDLRVTLREDGPFPEALLAGRDATPVDPEFEDAFADVLGLKTPAASVLAEQMPTIPDDRRTRIETRGLTRRFGDFVATDDVSFRVGRGEIFGLLGPNGAGKSTTFKMLCGLLKPTAGVARVMEEDLYASGAAAVRMHIGYMAQKFSLYGNLGVHDNLEFFAGVYGLRGAEKQAKIARMIDTFDLAPYLKSMADTLPLGLKQRLALACAVMHEPSILFLDEPTSGVDPITRKEFWTHINGMVKKGVSIMVTTHFMNEAEYCDRIMLIYHGKAIAVGTPDELKREAGDGATMETAFETLIRRYDG